MANKKKTRCKQGHKLIRKNLYTRKNGQRECRECSRMRSASAAQAKAVTA